VVAKRINCLGIVGMAIDETLVFIAKVNNHNFGIFHLGATDDDDAPA